MIKRIVEKITIIKIIGKEIVKMRGVSKFLEEGK